MLKVVFQKYFYSVFLIQYACSFDTESKQMIIRSLCRELSIKNIIFIKNPFSTINSSIISQAKYFSKFNIYHSFVPIRGVNNTMHKHNVTSKTIVILNEKKQEILNAVYVLISRNENNAFRFIWLVWIKDETTIKLLEQLYIPYNVQFLALLENFLEENIQLFEFYHPKMFSQRMFKTNFGKWTKNKTLEIFVEDFYRRRLNMHGIELIVVTFEESIMTEWGDIVWTVSELMKFRIIWTTMENFYLKIQPKSNTPWEIVLSPALMDHVFFDENFAFGPIWKLEAFMYLSYDRMYEDLSLSTYLRPFSNSLWYAFVFYIFVIGFCTFMIVKFTSQNFGYLSAFFQPFEVVLNQYGSSESNTKSLRFIIITSRFIALFLVPAYSAEILKFILVPDIKLPFESIEGLVKDQSYKLGFSTTTNLLHYFARSENKWMKTAYEKFLLNETEMPVTTMEANQQLCQLKKVAFILLDNPMFYADCEILKIPKPISLSWRGLFLRENSPYKRIFNRIFKSFLSSGILNKYDREDFANATIRRNQKPVVKENQVKLENVAPILKLLISFYGITLIMLLLEHLWQRIKAYLHHRLNTDSKDFK